MGNLTQLTSHERYRSRYFDPAQISKYCGKLDDTDTHHREIRCLTRALKNVPLGSQILDMPCGSARLLSSLTSFGFHVTCADVAPLMVEEAKKRAEAIGQSQRTKFAVADVLSTNFENRQFDAVICNRMFHHFNESDVRIKALKELTRISKKYVILSFFCTLSLSAFAFQLRSYLLGRKVIDRIPISLKQMKYEAKVAGLKVCGIYPTKPGLSKQWFIKLETIEKF